jgi:hypothetical protein
MRIRNANKLWSRWTKRKALIYGIVGLFCLISTFSLEAKEVYNGKCSDVFQANSSEISNQKVLQEIVDELKKEKGSVTLQIFLVCTVIGSPGNTSKSLGDERLEVLKRYFQQGLPGAVVTGKGQTSVLPAGKSKDDGPSLYGPDILRISATGAGVAENDQKSDKSKQEDPKDLEPWQKKLLERYKKIEEKHQFLCQDKKRETKVIREKCDFETQSSMAFHLCLLRATVSMAKYNKDAGSLYDVEYDMERIIKLRETSGDVYAIAQEIIKNKPSAGSITYSSSSLDQEIERQILAKKYLKRALKKLDLGIKHLPKVGGGDDNNHEINNVETTYNSWYIYDRMYAMFAMYKDRARVIDDIRELHNFVRTNLGLKKINDNRFFPICVFTNAYFSEGYTLEAAEKIYTRIQPRLQKYGISEIPLEEGKDK